MKHAGLSVAPLLALLSLSSGAAAPDPAKDSLVEDFVYGTLALTPVNATAAGYHEHHGASLDDALDDYSPRGIETWKRFLTSMQVRIDAQGTKRLDAEQRADFDIMRDAVGGDRLEFDEIQSYRHNPTLYVELVGNALYTPYVLQFAPPAERFHHIIERLKRVPALLGQARNNLIDSPEVWNRVAREENTGNLDLIDTTLRQDCPVALRTDFDAAATVALATLRDFNQWLEHDLAGRTSDWRLGKQVYAKKFRFALAINKTPERLLKEAEVDLERVRGEMTKLAAPQTVEAALAAVASDHAQPTTYMASAQQALAEATAFVKARDLLTLPERGNLQVIETPVFMRGIYGVGGFNAAPPLEPQLGAFYWVTPIPSDWPQARIDSKLREYNRSMLQHLSVHEAMPGHYVQAEYANDVQPQPRRLLRDLFANNPYVEGWAVYVQQLMADQGYQANTPAYQLTLKKQMLRVIANTILDIRLQTLGMTDDQAIELMTKRTYQEQEEATGKLQRAKLSSCQLPTYYAGFKGWLAVRTHYRMQRGGAFELKEFHERALKEGAVPLPVLDRLLR
ncbi:MAG: DUF885 domain-containing protein [Pseudomonadota bacterium]|nr:DUF885 domain-containing protein [Pseudomonadota bacterium]